MSTVEPERGTDATGVSNRLRWLAVAQRVIDYCSAQAKEVSGLSLTQSRILFHLAVYPGKRTASIAHSLNLRLTTAASALEVICEHGYAEKLVGNADSKRSTQFYLTELGYTQLPLYIEGFEEVFARFGEIVGTGALESVLHDMLPDGTISMVETCCDDNTLQPPDIYQRLHVPQGSDPRSALFDKAMYIEKIAWSLEEIDMRDTIGLPRKERLVLRALADLGGTAEVRELRSYLLIKPATASSALRGLQKRDFVTRVSDPQNRRVVIASITENGSIVEKETRPEFESLFDACFPSFAERPLPARIQPRDDC